MLDCDDDSPPKRARRRQQGKWNVRKGRGGDGNGSEDSTAGGNGAPAATTVLSPIVLDQSQELSQDCKEAGSRDQRSSNSPAPVAVDLTDEEDLPTPTLEGPSAAAAATSSSSSLSRKPEPEKKEDERCSICLGPYERREILCRLPCMHVFHKECVVIWLKSNKCCPIDKIEVCSVCTL